jgi:hypothetical protein
MINRENVGQAFELELTHIGSEILAEIKRKNLNLNDAYNLITKYIRMCSPEQADYMDEICKKMSEEEVAYFITNIVDSGAIHLSMRPITDTMSIDKLDAIYKEFPFVKQNYVEVALRNSEGEVRYIPARRKMVIGKQYIFRLKQFAEEKFSATSMSATNIRNENTKSRSKKDYKELYPNTPIRFGNMETNNMLHLGVEVVIANLMIHSVSPLGRRLVEQMYTGDPYNIDIKLDSDSSNRSAEIANTYMKTIGRQLVFEKKRKKRTKILATPIVLLKPPLTQPVRMLPKDLPENYDPVKAFKERNEWEKKKAKMNLTCPLKFIPRNSKRDDDE